MAIATRRLTPTDALKELNASEYSKDKPPIKTDVFRGIVTDPYYYGVVEMKRQIDERNEHGAHDPLISKFQHEIIVRIMDAEAKNQKGPRPNGNPAYPLSNMVTCEPCLGKQYPRFAGFNHGNGSRNGKVHTRYRCRSCKRYVSREELHEKLSNHLHKYRISDKNIEKLISNLSDVWDISESENVREIRMIEARLSALNKKKMQKIDAVSKPENSYMADELVMMTKQIKNDIEETTERRDKLQKSAAREKDAFIRFALEKVHDFDKTFLDVTKKL